VTDAEAEAMASRIGAPLFKVSTLFNEGLDEAIAEAVRLGYEHELSKDGCGCVLL